jgi:hypothetical protein
MHRSMLCAVVLTACLGIACAEPPNKEINQAQGAIDAARAAGAERYAESEYSAATTALQRANQSVTDGDYRMALNYALESREHAQNAARQAADNHARIRGEVERSMAEIAALLAQINTRVADAQRARVPRQTLRRSTESVARINEAVQKAGAAMKADDYLAAQPMLDGIRQQIEQTLGALNAAMKSQTLRRRR